MGLLPGLQPGLERVQMLAPLTTRPECGEEDHETPVGPYDDHDYEG